MKIFLKLVFDDDNFIRYLSKFFHRCSINFHQIPERSMFQKRREAPPRFETIHARLSWRLLLVSWKRVFDRAARRQFIPLWRFEWGNAWKKFGRATSSSVRFVLHRFLCFYLDLTRYSFLSISRCRIPGRL